MNKDINLDFDNPDNISVNSVNSVDSENITINIDDKISEETQVGDLSKYNNKWNNDENNDENDDENNDENNDENKSRKNIAIDTKYRDEFKLIKDQISTVIPKLFSTMTFIRYKSSILRFGYKFSSILIILFSSIITFIEALRANIERSPRIDLIITITTLTLSFIIALTASIVKFFNLQNKIERLNLLNNMLETPYLEASKLIAKENLKSENDINKQTVVKLREAWEKIIDQYAKPHIDAHSILHPNNVTQYMQRYNTQKKQIDDINLYNENIRSIRNIEEYIISLKKELVTNLHNEENDNVHYTLAKLKELNITLGGLNNELSIFKQIMSQIYNRDKLYNYKTEIQKIERHQFTKIRDLFCCFDKSTCCDKERESELIHT